MIELREYCVYPCGFPERYQRDLHALPKVLLILPLVSTVEAPQYHVLVSVVHRVLERQIPEQISVFPDNVINPVPHLPTLVEHFPTLV